MMGSLLLSSKNLYFLYIYIIKLFRALFGLNYFPNIWKSGIIILIPKPGLNDSNPKSKNYRPITLLPVLPVLGKIFERYLVNSLNYFLYSNDLMMRNQFGFLRQSSTVDALLEFKSYLDNCFNENKLCLAISLDISGAFDNACHSIIINNLVQLGCPLNIVKLYISYFNDRTNMVR